MDVVHLAGAEDVSRAAGRMADAAQTMSGAAYNIDCTLERHQRFMDDWLQRLQDVMDSDMRHRLSELLSEGKISPNDARKVIGLAPLYDWTEAAKEGGTAQ